LNVNASELAGDHGIISEDKRIALRDICDHSSTLELVELTKLNQTVSTDIVNAGCHGFVKTTSSEATVRYKTCCVFHLVNARYFL